MRHEEVAGVAESARLRHTDPWKLADEIGGLMSEAAAHWREGNRKKAFAAQGEIDALRDALAREFGRRRGWHYDGEGVPRRFVHLHRGVTLGLAFDHPYRYRTSPGCAVAAHHYGNVAGLLAMGRGRSRVWLASEFIADYPSWWLPGVTQLVVWREVGERADVGNGA